ncbi:MAG: formyltetrahydrofolate deformylase [Acidimicrobiales bacterium]
MPSHVLTLICPDRPGIVYAVCGALLEAGSDIAENAQFGDPDSKLFTMRTVFTTEETDSSVIADLVASKLNDPEAVLKVHQVDDRPKVMIMVSKFDHCLTDLLYRWSRGSLKIDIPLIVSNHPDCEALAIHHGVPYRYLPVTKDTKAEQEAQILALVEEHDIDLVVLARYMQILSDDMCTALAGRAINIHHSFLPGFKGAKPYHQAHERGVKIVGATAHFVTADLDEGPIIEQDIARVTHAHTAEQLVALGQDTERLVLSRAVRYWAEDRVHLIGSKTVIFP